MPLASEFSLLYSGGAPTPLGRVTACAISKNTGWTIKRKLGAYAIVYTLAGLCLYEDSSGRKWHIKPGDLMVVFPDVTNSYGHAPGRDWTQFYVIFEGPVFDVWRRVGMFNPSRFIYHLQPVEFWSNRFLTMVNAWPSANSASTVPICSLQALLSEAIETQGQLPAEQEHKAWLELACQRIAAVNSAPALNGPRLAEQMGMSYVTFRKKFTALARMSPGRYHALLVMRRACQWIHDESISSKEIAGRLGFCDEYYFSRRFKQIIGVSPSVYRRQMR